MAKLADYLSGKVATDVKKGLEIINSLPEPLEESAIGMMVVEALRACQPLRVSLDQAKDFIDQAEKCAAGDRVCQGLHQDAPATKSIFLDELAQGLVEQGKAVWVDKDRAVEILSGYRGHPLMVSKVSGKYMEICRSWPKKCPFWNLEMKKVKCVNRVNHVEI